MAPKEPPVKKAPMVLVKKKRKAKHRLTGGLPSFSVPRSAAVTAPKRDDAFNDHHDDEEADDDLIASLPSETMMVIRDLLHHSDNCLQIPLTNGGFVSSILECQLHQRLMESGRSNNVSRELDNLCQTNQIQKLSSTDAEPVCVYLTKAEYETAVRDALRDTPDLGEWFLRNQTDWKGRDVDEQSLLDTLRNDPLHGNVQVIIRKLLDGKVLLGSNPYRRWLPHFGLVLSKLHKAAKDTTVFIKQSAYKERSVASVIKRLQYSPIPVEKLLLPWMVSQGMVSQVERPSGTFLKLLDD